MGILHNFTVSVLVIAVVCFFCEALSMDGPLAKYTSCVTGLVVSLVLVSTLLQVRTVDFSELTIPMQTQSSAQTQTEADAVLAAFKTALTEAVESGLAQNLGVQAKARAQVTHTDGVLTVTGLEIAADTAHATAIENYVQAQFGIMPHVEEAEE